MQDIIARTNDLMVFVSQVHLIRSFVGVPFVVFVAQYVLVYATDIIRRSPFL